MQVLGKYSRGKLEASVLLKLFINDNESCHTIDAPITRAELLFSRQKHTISDYIETENCKNTMMLYGAKKSKVALFTITHESFHNFGREDSP